MHTHNDILVRAPLEACFAAAADVERWPDILPHYRRVRFHRKDAAGVGRVEMAATRHFGPLPYPVWWVSEMRAEPTEAAIFYRHVDGITRGMEVAWRLERAGPATTRDDRRSDEETRMTIVHDWSGPGWPLVGRFAARRVIGPRFIRIVASRTLEGIRRHVEAGDG